MTEYDELLKEARKKVEDFHRSTAIAYIPRMYYALRKEKISPEDAREKIEKDCVGIWSDRTILNVLPDEAKDPKRQKAGRLRQKEPNCAAFSAAQSPTQKKKQIIIDTKGKPIQDDITPLPSRPNAALLADDDHSKSNSNDSKLQNDDLAHFEFSLPSSEVFYSLFLNDPDKEGKGVPVWFNGTLDKRSGKVIFASIGRITSQQNKIT